MDRLPAFGGSMTRRKGRDCSGQLNPRRAEMPFCRSGRPIFAPNCNTIVARINLPPIPILTSNGLWCHSVFRSRSRIPIRGLLLLSAYGLWPRPVDERAATGQSRSVDRGFILFPLASRRNLRKSGSLELMNFRIEREKTLLKRFVFS